AKQLDASRVADSVDANRDGTMDSAEIEAFLDRFDPALARLIGPQAASRLKGADDFEQRVETEKAASTISTADLKSELQTLCKDPILNVGDAPERVGYRKAAEHVAAKLADAGFAPLGDSVNGDRSYLQAFRWQTRFGDRRPASTWNVVGMLPGT